MFLSDGIRVIEATFNSSQCIIFICYFDTPILASTHICVEDECERFKQIVSMLIPRSTLCLREAPRSLPIGTPLFSSKENPCGVVDLRPFHCNIESDLGP